MENMVGVCGVLPKTWRVHPLRSVARATQTIDHHKETIFIKWAQHSGVWGGSSWKIWVVCAVCSLQPAGRDHCVLLRAPRKLLTISRRLSSLSGLDTRGWGRSWKIWLVCAVCFLKPEGCTHCVLLRAPRRLLTITRKRSSWSGLNTRGFEGGAHGKSGWRVRCAPCKVQGATIAFCCERLAGYLPSPGNVPR